MAIGYSRYLTAVYTVIDIVILNLAFAGVSIFKRGLPFHPEISFFAQFVYINVLWLIILLIFRITEFERGIPYEKVLSTIIKTVVIHFLLLAAVNNFLSGIMPVISNFFTKYFVFIILLFTWRSVMWLLLNFIRRRGLNYRKVVLLGGGELSLEIRQFFHGHPEIGYRLEGIFLDEYNPSMNGEVKGNIEDSKQFALEHEVDEIYCALSELSNEQVSDIMKFADSNMIRFRVIPDFRGFLNKKVQIDFYRTIPVLSVMREPLQSLINRFAKRLFDIAFAIVVIIFVFPVLVPAFSILIRLSSHGPIFFRQLRSGKDNRSFTCFKFRTMRVNNVADELQASRNDARITGIGKWLRKTSLDELPQFFNVLIGNMSVVGPRPHMLRHTEEYSKLVDRFMVRHFIKPGITGWAQVNGFRGETIEPSQMKKRVEHDVWYIENWSMLLDLKIIMLTIRKMIYGDENAR